MTYFDDILNVNGYLREKMRKNAEKSRDLMERIEREKAGYAALKSDVNALLAQLEALADQLGVQMPPEEPPEEKSVKNCAELLVKLPDNYDFAMAFEKLRDEAHAAGFRDVHPEDLLSKAEMDEADAFYEAIEANFKEKTQLRGKDMAVLAAAVAAHIVCKAVFSLQLKGEDHQAAEEVLQAVKETQTSAAQAEPFWTAPPTVEPGGEEAPMLDAFAGVKLDFMPTLEKGTDAGVDRRGMTVADLLRNMRSFSGTLSQGEQVISRLTGSRRKSVGVKMDYRILGDSIPFDMPDNEFFQRKDALGYDKWLGWVFGVLNIMTDTVTTRKMRSFSVEQPMGSGQHPTIVQKISTPVHLVLPVMASGNIKNSLLAAVVREAGVLEVTKAPPEEVAMLLARTFAEEEKNLALLQEAGNAANYIPEELDWGAAIWGITRDTAVAAFLNQVITAIHALMYDPETDGPVETYAIRTNTVLTVSSAIAAMFNSLPALIEQNPAKIDFAGIITTCLSVFNSTRFWIDVKTEYLLRAYQPGVEEQLAIVDKYFEFVST